MAAPIVAGVCALMLQTDPTMTPAEVKARLMETAIDKGYTANEQGSGLVDAQSAVFPVGLMQEAVPTTLSASTALRSLLLYDQGLQFAMQYGAIYVYSGARPGADAAPAGALLGAITADGEAFAHGALANGVFVETGEALGELVAEVPLKLNCVTTGTIGWWRWVWNGTHHPSGAMTPWIDGDPDLGLRLGFRDVEAGQVYDVPRFSVQLFP
jgi:hypothetical protein